MYYVDFVVDFVVIFVCRCVLVWWSKCNNSCHLGEASWAGIDCSYDF